MLRKVEDGEAKLDADSEGGSRPPDEGDVTVGGRVSVMADMAETEMGDVDVGVDGVELVMGWRE